MTARTPQVAAPAIPRDQRDITSSRLGEAAGRTFRDLREGDLVYSVHSYGRGKNKRQIVHCQKVTRVWLRGAVRGGLFSTLPCYPDGEVYLFFGMWFRRSSGVEYANYQFEQPTDRPRVRLLLDAPEGIPLHERQQPELRRAAA